MSARAILLAACFASAARGGEIDALRKAIDAQPGSLAARQELAAACEKAGDRLGAQRAWWAACQLAEADAAARSKAREALLRLDKGWKAVLDLDGELQADWKKLSAELAKKGDPALDRMAALWRRTPLVVDEEWCSARNPLDAFTKVTFEWKGSKTLGKDGLSVLEVPQKERKEFAGRTVVVEALEIAIEGSTHSKEPELEITVQVGTGKLTWGKVADDPKAPVWVLARRVGSRDEAMQPIRFWLRYYPPKGIGVGIPLCDPRMRGSGKPIKVTDTLAAALRLESLLPRNKIEVSAFTLTLYVRDRVGH